MQRLLALKQSSILIVLGLLIGLGFLITTLASYQTSRSALRDNVIHHELPLAANSIYLEIQNDLLSPVQVSSAMASDAFLLEWIAGGERNPALISRYLAGVKQRYDTSIAFFASDATSNYYYEDGVLHQLEPDAANSQWFYRFKASGRPWEVVVDVARNAMFINYRVVNEQGRFLGAAGIGLTVDRLLALVDSYQQRYERNIYFFDSARRLVLSGSQGALGGLPRGTPLATIEALQPLAAQQPALADGSYQYQSAESSHYVIVRHIPELDWHLIVDRQESGIIAPIRRMLWINLAICLAVTAVVLALVGTIIRRYLGRIEALAIRDSLTGLLNRRGFSLLADQTMREARRRQAPICVLILDLDRFKSVNDTHGHLAGDRLLEGFARRLEQTLRRSDQLARWGGEEFVVLLKDSTLDAARTLAEKIRAATEAEPFDVGPQSLSATVSIGLACLAPKESLERLIDRADQALYEAKRNGRNRVQGHTEP